MRARPLFQGLMARPAAPFLPRSVVLKSVWLTFLPDDKIPRSSKRLAPVPMPGVLDFVRDGLRFQPDERQAEVLASRAKRGILNCSRQWGKSTVAAAKAVHRAYTEPR